MSRNGSNHEALGLVETKGLIATIAATDAMAKAANVTLAGLPLFFLHLDNFLAAGLFENLMQAIVQGAFAGAGAIYLFTRAVVLLGVGRAVLYPALVPPFTLLIGAFAIGEIPSLMQLIGLVVVIAGFRLTQKG